MPSWKVVSTISFISTAVGALPLHYAGAAFSDWSPLALLLALALLAAAVSALIGCACCHRLRDKRDGVPAIQGFNNATYDPTPAGELTLFPPLAAVAGRPQFEPLPDLGVGRAGAALHPRPAIYNLSVSRGFSAKDWFDDPHRNFPRQQLKYQQELGAGWFGQALLGEARNLTAEPKTEVVVKVLRTGATLPEQMYFLHEMSLLRDANHPHVLRLLGRCVEADPYLLILEKCGVGDAKEFLQSRSPVERQRLLDTMSLNKIATEAAAGLQHLHDIHYTHSDLAARSCRVMENCTLKIGDYGCNIDKYREDYYIAGEVALPVRWCAPEILECTASTIETKEVTKASNVWSLGVLLWELLAFAALPYAPLSDDDVIQHVVMDRNVQLSRPKLSTGSPHTDRMYQVMQLCWLPSSQRPTVHRIHALLSQLTAPPKDDFEERWEALRPRGRADGGSGSASPEPSQPSQPASLDSELHDALRSLDRMLAAEETVSEVADGSGADVTDPGTAHDGSETGESGGEGEGAGLSPLAREQSRSVQDFLMLTAPLDSLELSSEHAGSDGSGEDYATAMAAPPVVKVSTSEALRSPLDGRTDEVRTSEGSDLVEDIVSDTLPASGEESACAVNASVIGRASETVSEAAPMVKEHAAQHDLKHASLDSSWDGDGAVGIVPKHVVPELCVVEATPPRPPVADESVQLSTSKEPPTIDSRAFRFVMKESMGSSSDILDQSKSVIGDSEADLTANTDTNIAANISWKSALTADPSAEQLTSTPRERSPACSDYVDSTYQTALEDVSSQVVSAQESRSILMGSRQSVPVYSALGQHDFDDLNYDLSGDVADSNRPDCGVPLLATSAGADEDEDGDDAEDVDDPEIKRAIESPPGAAGDVAQISAVKHDWPPLSPTPGEAGSPPRSPSLSSTFGHSTCDELAELQDEDEVRSLGSRAELVPSKLWGSAEGWGSPQTQPPERKLSADVITIIEIPPAEADSTDTIVLPGEAEPSASDKLLTGDGHWEGQHNTPGVVAESMTCASAAPAEAAEPENINPDDDVIDVKEKTGCDGRGGCKPHTPLALNSMGFHELSVDMVLAQEFKKDKRDESPGIWPESPTAPEFADIETVHETLMDATQSVDEILFGKDEPVVAMGSEESSLGRTGFDKNTGEAFSSDETMDVDSSPDIVTSSLVGENYSPGISTEACMAPHSVQPLCPPVDDCADASTATVKPTTVPNANSPMTEKASAFIGLTSTPSHPSTVPSSCEITSPSSSRNDTLTSLEGSGGFELSTTDLPLPLTAADPNRKYMLASEAAASVEADDGSAPLDDGQFWQSLRQAAEQTARLVEEARRDSPERESSCVTQSGGDEDGTSVGAVAARSGNYRTMFLVGEDRTDDVNGNEAPGRDRMDSGGFDSLSGLGTFSSLSNEAPADDDGGFELTLDDGVALSEERGRCSALDAVRLELSRALPDTSDSSGEHDADATEPPAMFCTPSVPMLETISEEAEEEEELDPIPDSWRQQSCMEVETDPPARLTELSDLPETCVDSGLETGQHCPPYVTAPSADGDVVTSYDGCNVAAQDGVTSASKKGAGGDVTSSGGVVTSLATAVAQPCALGVHSAENQSEPTAPGAGADHCAAEAWCHRWRELAVDADGAGSAAAALTPQPEHLRQCDVGATVNSDAQPGVSTELNFHRQNGLDADSEGGRDQVNLRRGARGDELIGAATDPSVRSFADGDDASSGLSPGCYHELAATLDGRSEMLASGKDQMQPNDLKCDVLDVVNGNVAEKEPHESIVNIGDSCERAGCAETKCDNNQNQQGAVPSRSSRVITVETRHKNVATNGMVEGHLSCAIELDGGVHRVSDTASSAVFVNTVDTGAETTVTGQSVGGQALDGSGVTDLSGVFKTLRPGVPPPPAAFSDQPSSMAPAPTPLVLEDLDSPVLSRADSTAAATATLGSVTSDSDSDLLVIDTESHEARLLEGGRPRSHVAFMTSQEGRVEEGAERALEARFDLARKDGVRADQLMPQGRAMPEGDSDYEGDYESLPADGGAISAAAGAALAPDGGALTRSVASYNLAESATRGWTEPAASWEYPSAEPAGLLQPRSLPVQPRYTVLSQSLPLARLERRFSVPPSAASTALTAEEWVIDASIPTYDDVRSFGDGAASLSSSEEGALERAGPGTRDGKGRRDQTPGQVRLDAVAGWGEMFQKAIEADKVSENMANGGPETVPYDTGVAVAAAAAESVSKDEADCRLETELHPRDRPLHYATQRQLEQAEEEAVQEELPVEDDLEEDGDASEKDASCADAVGKEGGSGISENKEGSEEAKQKAEALETEAGYHFREGRLSPGEEMEPGQPGETNPAAEGHVSATSRSTQHPYKGEPNAPEAAPSDMKTSLAAVMSLQLDDLTPSIDGLPSRQGPTESTDLWSPSNPSAFPENLLAVACGSSEQALLLDSDDELAAEEAASDSRQQRLRRLNQQWGVPEREQEEGGRYTPDWEEDDGSSSTSGEFVWQEGGAVAERDDSGGSDDSESGEEEFTPSVWRQDRQPDHGVLRSPQRRSELRKSVSFKRQKHHRIYEYPLASPEPEPEPEVTGAQGRRAWSFVAPASVSHYTDWELDGEEIEDVSLTELTESPDHQAPRLTAASHYFLSATADDDDDAEFFIRDDCRAQSDGFRGGSSFTPGSVFPQAALWPTAGAETGVSAGGALWAGGGDSGAGDNNASSRVSQSEAGAGSESGKGLWRLGSEGPGEEGSERPSARDKDVWRIGLGGGLDPNTHEESEARERDLRRVAPTEGGAAVEEARWKALWAVGGSSGCVDAVAVGEDLMRSGADHGTQTAAPAGGTATTQSAATPDVLTSVSQDDRMLVVKTSKDSEVLPVAPAAPAAEKGKSAVSARVSAGKEGEPATFSHSASDAAEGRAVADSAVIGAVGSVEPRLPPLCSAGGSVTSELGAAEGAGTAHRPRPARESLYLDLSRPAAAAPALPTADSGYTGSSCDDLTVAAFAAAAD